jgi:hypothetical protein
MGNMAELLCQVCRKPTPNQSAICEECLKHFPYSFKEQEYGIEFLIAGTIKPSQSAAEYVAAKMIANHKARLFSDWQKTTSIQLAGTSKVKKMDELFRATPLPALVPVTLDDLRVLASQPPLSTGAKTL